MAKKSEGKTVTVEQTGSPIRRPSDQRATLIGLGLNTHPPPHDAAGHSRRARHDRQGQPPRPRRRRSLREDSR